MLKRQPLADSVKITFALPLDVAAAPVSVVGDFNDWDPLAHPLRKRTNGTRSVTIEVPPGSVHRFKYLADGGTWFCEPHADDFELNEFHEVNSVLRV